MKPIDKYLAPDLNKVAHFMGFGVGKSAGNLDWRVYLNLPKSAQIRGAIYICFFILFFILYVMAIRPHNIPVINKEDILTLMFLAGAFFILPTCLVSGLLLSNLQLIYFFKTGKYIDNYNSPGEIKVR